MILFLLDHNEERIDDIEAWEVTRDRELGGFDILTFKTRYRDLEKRHRIVLRMPDLKWQEYIVDGIIESRDYVEVTCQHAIYELYGDFIEDRRPEGTCDQALDVILEHTRWTRSNPCTVGTILTNSFYRTSARAALADLLDRYDVEMEYSVEVDGAEITARYIWLEERIGNDLGRRFEAGRDADTVLRTVETDHIVTALYPFGSGETKFDEEGNPTGGYGRRVNIAPVNGGKMYVENTAARLKYGRLNSDKTRAHIFGKVEYDDTEDPAEIKERGEMALIEMSQPRVTYSGRVIDLSQVGGFDHEGVEVGDVVTLIDDEQSIEVQGRVLRYKNVLDMSSLSEIVLGNYRDPLKRQKATEADMLAWMRDLLATDVTRGGIENAHLRYVREVLDHWSEHMNEGLTTGSITPFPGGFLFESETGATMIGPMGTMIANSKLPNGEWDWRTFQTGDGLGAEIVVGENIKAGEVESDHISSTGISAEKIKLEDSTTAQSAITQLQADQLTMIDQINAVGDVFTDIPQPPYKAGDVWHMPELTVDYWLNSGLTVDQVMALGITVDDRMGGNSYVCINSRETGSFTRSDWMITGSTDKMSVVYDARFSAQEVALTEEVDKIETELTQIRAGYVRIVDIDGTYPETIIDGGVINTGSVTVGKLADGAVTEDKLANGAVGTVKIADGAIIGDKLAVNSITAAKLSTIAGFTFSDSTMSSGSGTSRVYISGNPSFSPYAIIIGGDSASTAPFRVSRAGALVARNATITGTVTSANFTSSFGQIGPLKISSQGLTYTSSGRFQINASGYLVASGVELSGKLSGCYKTGSGGIWIDQKNHLTRIKDNSGNWRVFGLRTFWAASDSGGGTTYPVTALAIVSGSPGGEPPDPGNPGGPGTSVYPL